MWFGDNAKFGYTTANCFINNGSRHPAVLVTSTIDITTLSIYPIRIIFGEGGGGDNFSLSFKIDSGVATSDFTGYVFSSTGLDDTYPSYNADFIIGTGYRIKDNVYNIIVNNVSTPTYCLMDYIWNGGGYMMLMKASRGNTFTYSSTYWTDNTTTLNTTSTNLSDMDAKFNTFNHYKINSLLVLWPDLPIKGGSEYVMRHFNWVHRDCNSGTKETALWRFTNTTNLSSDAKNFALYTEVNHRPIVARPWRQGIFSSQPGANQFGYNSISTWKNVRFGFQWNNENDFLSVDVIGGIGLNTGHSAGDFLGCCQRYDRFE